MAETDLRVFGIRHHGPGTARALLDGLARFAPDCVLVEGPPDGDALIPWLAHPALVMPVALLVYRPDRPARGVFYPFAEFSPEYQALRYALAHGATAAFFDLPRRHTLAVDYGPAMPPAAVFRELAEAAGYRNYEGWWNMTVEQTRGGADVFAAVLELTAEMRRAAEAPVVPANESREERMARQREAAMRRRIREFTSVGHRRIAAVCGAWHAPALVDAHLMPGDEDEALLADLPAAEVDASWVPWTYGRLTQSGGYGAGLASPGWYDHLWRAAAGGLAPAEMSARWLSEAAALLREEGQDTSPGHVIETVRLAEALAALRGRPFPGLPELEEAALSVMCGGDEEPMRLIRRRLIVGERMGMVPPDAPAVPLQRDLSVQQARLKLSPDPEPNTLTLDLRQELDLDRSRLLHRLNLLDIPWGQTVRAKGPQTGTYAELWQLQWSPDLAVRVIEAAAWGNTVRDAAAARAIDRAGDRAELPELTEMVDRVIAADLPEVLPAILARIEELAALSRDVVHMLATLPPLAGVLRYGGLRQTADHLPLLRRVFDHLLTRACLGLPGACVSLDESAAEEMMERITAAGSAVRLARDEAGAARWHEALSILIDRGATQPMVAGRATRLLFDDGVVRAEGVLARLERALTPTGSADVSRYAAEWLDGLLRDSGLLLIHDRPLWSAVDRWLMGLDDRRFEAVLPLLRRTFSSYPDGIRQQLQQRLDEANRGGAKKTAAGPAFDPQRAAAVLPWLGLVLGVEIEARETSA